MQASQVNSLSIPIVGSQNPATLFKAAGAPMRVVVRNTGPNLLFIAHDIGVLQAAPAFAGTYRLLAGLSETFVLAPGQGLFAACVGLAGQASIAASEALPIH